MAKMAVADHRKPVVGHKPGKSVIPPDMLGNAVCQLEDGADMSIVRQPAHDVQLAAPIG